MPIFLTDDPISNYGGIQRYVARLASTLGQRGERAVVIQPRSENVPAWPNVRIVPFGKSKNHVRSIVNELVAYVAEIRKAPREPSIASVWFPSGLVAALTPRAIRGPLAVMAQGLEIAPSRRGIRRALMRWTYARADIVVACSVYTQRLLESAGVRARSVVVVACGADPKASERSPAHEPTLLSVGRLVARKGFDRTIAAMPAILAEIPDARFRIVGDGPQREELQALAVRVGVDAHVDFLGPLDDESLTREYARAWCFAMPCRRIGDDFEGFGIVYLEAAMAGLPCIGGIESGAADAMEDGVTGTLVDGDDPGAIARAALTYLRDVRHANEVGARGRRRVLEHFTWAHNADAIRAALSSI
jgi:phosphatidylinositol alpha-1,6-mannosyltransferase